MIKELIIEHFLPFLAIIIFNYIKWATGDDKSKATKTMAIIETPLDIIFFSISYIIIVLAKAQNVVLGMIFFLMGIGIYIHFNITIKKEIDTFEKTYKINIVKIFMLYLFSFITIVVNIKFLG